MAMENACGKAGHRTKKIRNLYATSRSIIIEGTKHLREKFGGSFRDYRKVSIQVKETKTAHNRRQDQIAGEKISNKQANNLNVEGRLLNRIDELKDLGGPFTKSEDIDNFIKDDTIDTKVKTRRMKTEVLYARDTSLSVPKTNPVFRIRNKKLPGQKSRQLIPTLNFTPKQFYFHKNIYII